MVQLPPSKYALISENKLVKNQVLKTTWPPFRMRCTDWNGNDL